MNRSSAGCAQRSTWWVAARLLLLAEIAALTGCSVGPNYHPPESVAPGRWAETDPTTATNLPPYLAEWWKTLHEPTLDELIERAACTNYDLQAATARVKAARALRGAVVADFLPTIGASASWTTARRSANALTTAVKTLDTDTYQAGFDATWEIDVFGGRRRALQAATADLQAIEEDRRAVLVSLFAEVARNYVEYRGTQRQLGIARENLAAQQEVLDLTQLRLSKGLASELEVAQAQALLATTKAQVPNLNTALKESSHRLCVLLGQPPGTLDADLTDDDTIPAPPPEVPAGLPSDLLLHRPDVRRVERQLAAATARIGVATAELFPKFYLSGAGGLQSLDAGTLVEPASKFWSAGPSVRWRLLEYPRLKAQINAQTAQQEQVLAQFNQIILLALEDVENAMVACNQERQRFESLREAAEASRRALDLANELYTKGLGDFLNVLIAERSLYQAQDAQVQSQKIITENVIALYKALGGGWQTETRTD